MAWYAEEKRRNTWLINGWDAVFFYKKLLYEQAVQEYQAWFDSLTPEEQEKERDRKERRHTQAERDVQAFLIAAGIVSSVMTDMLYPKRYR